MTTTLQLSGRQSTILLAYRNFLTSLFSSSNEFSLREFEELCVIAFGVEVGY